MIGVPRPKCAVVLLAFVSSISTATAAFAQAEKPTKTKSGFVTTSDGVKIHYLEAGETRKPNARIVYPVTLLFVPGWTMAADIWEKQIAYFSQTHRVVAIDPRGQGQSTKATDGLYPAMRARDIKAVVDQLKLAPVALIGWSMAVPELVAYVDQFGTDTLPGLVLVDGVILGGIDPKMTAGMFTWVAGFQTDRAKFTAGFVRSMYRKPQSEEYLKRVTDTSLETPTSVAMALFLGSFTSNYLPALAKVDKPALIVIAAGEPFQPIYEDMHRRLVHSRLEIFDGVGHALFVDDSERFNSLLDDFLAGLPAPAKSQ